MANREILTNIQLKKGATAFVSFAATAALNAGLAYADREPVVAETCTTETVQTVDSTTIRVPKMYARRFGQDPAVPVVLDPVKTEAVVETAATMRAAGETGITAVVNGVASGEDDAIGPDKKRSGGFQEPSDKNKQLAAARASTYEDQTLRPLFSVSTVKDVPVIDGHNHREVPLTDRQMKELTRISLMHNIRPADLVDTYNGILPGTVPADTKDFLDEIFARNRGVDVTVSGIKTEVQNNCTETKVPVPVAIPIFEAVIAAQQPPTTGPVHIGYAPVKQLAPQWIAKRPIKMKEPHPQGQGPHQIDSHIARTHGGDRGIARNTRVKGSKRGN